MPEFSSETQEEENLRGQVNIKYMQKDLFALRDVQNSMTSTDSLLHLEKQKKRYTHGDIIGYINQINK